MAEADVEVDHFVYNNLVDHFVYNNLASFALIMVIMVVFI